MNLEIANKAIKAAICASESINVKSNIAVVDAGANLVAFARMDNSPLGTVDISIKRPRLPWTQSWPNGGDSVRGLKMR